MMNSSYPARLHEDLGGEARWEMHGKRSDELQTIACRVINPIPPLAHQHPPESIGAPADEIRYVAP